MLTWENTWQDIEASGAKVAVVPIGAAEQHGTNLPLASDSLFTQHIAEAIAREINAYLVPMLPFGQSDEWLEYPGTISLSAETMKAVVADIVRSLARTGFTRILFLSMHGGNEVLWSGYLEQLAAQHPGLVVLNVDLVPPLEQAAKMSGLPFPVHADAMEASLLAVLRPDLVGPDPTDCPTPPAGHPKGRTLRQVSPGGSFGEPSKASRAQGALAWQVLLRRTIDAVLEHLQRR